MGHPIDRGKKYEINLTGGSEYGGVRIAASAFGTNESVQFDAYGVPSSSGLVVVALGSLQAQVRLAAGSGKVTVAK